DEQERELSNQDLMICDVSGPMVIAGVFGGIRSVVTTETKNLFIESATFDPRTIRKTARHHGLQTDASFRYERGTDIDITLYALKRAALLIGELTGGVVSSGIIDVYPDPKPEAKVFLSWNHLDRLIGQEIDRNEVRDILASLVIKIVAETPEGLSLDIPRFKVDVTREADVIEEVLRIYGYNNLVFSDNIKSPLNIGAKPDAEKLQNVIAGYLTSVGFNEIMNNSLTRSAYYEGNQVFPPENLVRMLNPLSRDLDVMRQSLIYGGLEVICYNQNRKVQDQKLYEFGNCYAKIPVKEHSTSPLDAYREEKHLALFLTGKATAENWNNPEAKLDFFHLKAYVQNILNRIGIDPGTLDPQPWESPMIREGLSWNAGKKQLVSFGILSKEILKQFDLRQEVYYADFSWDLILKKVRTDDIEIKELPKFPEVRRDLALVLDRSISFGEIERLAFQTEKNILKQVGLFDVYEGEKIGADKKSYALSFILADEKKTLTEQEIDKTMNKLIRAFEEKLSARLR
ncbi:MAG TPA: phenylalanine--tRNA ligase subunit beta, partial [Bacteroidales bacterium]|nr:phenylalanine--tRNA ligase subunit beta [Bacteroidales bacterium]